MSNGAQDAMPTPGTTSLHNEPIQSEAFFQRRLRHITSIQIRNLTPFPFRDAFASALLQPAAHSQFTPLGNLSDDLDVTLLRRRSRRISSASATTLRNVSGDDASSTVEEAKAIVEGRGRRRTQSRVSFSNTGSVGPNFVAGPVPFRPTATSSSTPMTKLNRVRTTSTVSSTSAVSPSGANTVVPTMGVAPAPFYLDHSQKTLERVIHSRLVETFITLTVPEPPAMRTQLPSANGQTSPGLEPTPFPSPARDSTPQATRKLSRVARSSSVGATNALSNRPGPSALTRPATSARKSVTKTVSVSASRPPAKTHKMSYSFPHQKASGQKHSLPSSAEPSTSSRPPVPHYISPIHRPSTNPIYVIDAQSNFAEHTDLGADRFKIQLWAKIDPGSPSVASGHAKGKQKEDSDARPSARRSGWKVLEEWILSISDLVPLCPEFENNPSHLPLNTLVVSFMPFGQTYYLPRPSRSRSRSHSRSESPSGYNTDPESEARKLGLFDRPRLSVSPDPMHASDTLPRLSGNRRSRKLSAKTASSQDLLQIATLQASILDAEALLRDVIIEINRSLQTSDVITLKREVSERGERIHDRQTETRTIVALTNCLRDDIASRRKQLQERRNNLAKARALHAEDVELLRASVAQVAEQRSDLAALRNRLPPIRTSLISALEAIYPIELLSASELLFTILAVPLPIPFNATEPAPPLSLPGHKDVTDDAVATALGYAAHLVQLIAVYMGKGLVYPITCIGSRSLIRDNISAMVGPRMFPLFSKGVDTYRFEYGVFLLNKDIEMLMADRDLRALDMRHTLPNLKNLLLTLTDGECASPS
ncbi:hypothetical protein F5I97DRAFT_1623789 [Phlebopus sp. FC_14]|nr:hypothetical protein F5I97DRAFT_1623789 [Phlebopus sp. FC_14]